MDTRGALLTLLSSLILPPLARAQEPAPPLIASVSGGLGVATPAIGGQVSLSVSHQSGDYILRAAGTSDFEIFIPAETSDDVALLYGRRTRWSRGWARAAAGPAIVRVVERGEVGSCAWFVCDYDMDRTSTVGLATQFDLVWAPSRAFGLGLTALGNVNDVRSFGALTLSVHLGRVR